MSVTEVSVDELEAALHAGARLIDVREPTSTRLGHVPGAVTGPAGTVPEHSTSSAATRPRT